MNWKEIQTKCPKSFELFKQWFREKYKDDSDYGDACVFIKHDGFLKVTRYTGFIDDGSMDEFDIDIKIDTRMLYDFFDDKNMFMFLSLDFADNKQKWKAYWHSGNYWNQPLCFFYDNRTSCESYAFELLFKQLENDK